MKKSLLNKINEVNALCVEIKQAYNEGLIETPTTYDGGTWPYEINVKCITVKNQFVYIDEVKNRYSYGFEKRYNSNKLEGGFNSLEDLNYALNLIRKTYKKELKTIK
tara:strand:- start:160 stop:480 length:321 start_codon:yes stop_codon:yes gene_type:complete